ncbi:MAG: hypothetical protein CMO81_03855 [Waddliaceae bacterium]|nr:hypothetical protein [Waddliaceae bacterium]
MARTKDEKLLVKLYQEARRHEDTDINLDPYLIGKAMGLREHAVKVMVNTLTQANFVKKVGKLVYITSNGYKLAEELCGAPA